MAANNGNNPFSWARGDTKTLAATTSSQEVTWTDLSGGSEARDTALRVYNAASVAAFIRLVDSTSEQAATVAADLPIAPGAVEVVAGRFNRVSVILPSSTGTVYLTRGNGI